jgi:SNF2 family DNA or RNA helicase
MRQIVGYQNTDDLLEKIAPYCFRIAKEDALPDLPPKQYNTVPIQPSPEQQNAFTLLEAEMRMEQGDDEIEVSTILERTLRFQQVAGGNFPLGDSETKPLDGKNPKMEVLLDLIQQMPPDAKAIIWAQFIPEINLISDTLAKEGLGHTLFYGAIDDAGRKDATKKFQEDSQCRFMISNRTGAKGQTWTAATYVFYYSNDFSYVNRVQSEDRCHRAGQTNHVHYYDLVLQHPKSDIAIHNALTKKQSLAEYAMENLTEFQL